MGGATILLLLLLIQIRVNKDSHPLPVSPSCFYSGDKGTSSIQLSDIYAVAANKIKRPPVSQVYAQP